MLLPPRTYQLAQTPDKGAKQAASPFLHCTKSRKDKLAAQQSARRMLLVHQAGSVKVGEVVRYTLTYTPAEDRILPSPQHLCVKVRNTSAIPLRAAYLHGPYTLHVAAYPSTFNPNRKVENPKKDGVPDFEPNLKAGGSFTTTLVVPEDIREHGGNRAATSDDGQPKSATWIIEIHSQILFSNSASVNFEVLVGRDERSVEYGVATGAAATHGQVQDHQQGQHKGRRPSQPKGVYSRAVKLVVDDTTSLWNKPALPEWEDEGEDKGAERASQDGHTGKESQQENKVKKQKNIHVVIITHGLHSNLGADMLYLKESIDASAAQARMDARKRKRAARKGKPAPEESDNVAGTSTAPLSGGQEDIDEDAAEDDDSDDEEVIVRGFGGNAVRTERGIQYLGKRLAKHILELTHPDQPFLPVKKTLKKKMSHTFAGSKQDEDEGIPAHGGSSVHQSRPGSEEKPRAYRYTSISFVGHSLGGLVQTYAVAYIHKHSPEFFLKIKPVNFICLASPLLGLSNENPMYVKFALDFGLVGRTGQDLGLTWRPPTLARNGWAAMVSGFGGQKDQKQEDPGAKPLLRILPTGPAHQVLRMFRNRTVYSNVVNDGIVPLRTSCLLFLDWRGLGRVEKARRENGLVGTLASWGFAELTGQNSSPNPSRLAIPDMYQNNDDSGTSTPITPIGEGPSTTVPQPGEDAVNQDETAQASSEPQSHQFLSDNQRETVQSATSPKKAGASNQSSASNTNPITGFINYLKGATTTPKDKRMYKRSQTLMAMGDEGQEGRSHSSEEEQQQQQHGRPPATRGDSSTEDAHNDNAPPKTTLFEMAGDILNPPIPPMSWIIDPATRSRTIFHDRVYHPEDIPPPPLKRPGRMARSFSEHSVGSTSTAETAHTATDGSGMRVEEKIARSYHKDLSWRKVLVRLEPDAHNNIVVRRMFANAYGWPVIQHLCDTHFADTWTARTRDEREPARDRAKRALVPGRAEEVSGQRARGTPPLGEGGEVELREEADELAPLREAERGTGLTLSPSSAAAAPRDADAALAAQRLRRQDSENWDDAYFEGGEDSSDDEGRGGSNGGGGYFQRFLSPAPRGKKGASAGAGAKTGQQQQQQQQRAVSGPTSAPGSASISTSTPTPAGPTTTSTTAKSTAPDNEQTSRDEAELAFDAARAGTSAAEIADFLTSSPRPSMQVQVEGHRGLGWASDSRSGFGDSEGEDDGENERERGRGKERGSDPRKDRSAIVLSPLPSPGLGGAGGDGGGKAPMVSPRLGGGGGAGASGGG
ncbi:uncharacterized protein K452DRAFT_295667 [Aplosporella prunicola CBS 121167]|uniref:DUF676 domain-containing protein n=1 Tax=Aplosporella prunicola CBS 121167 TaxID=1176127 RepID=A0A6A6BPF9_9PEZI|nr:uncharacterized protein K452DRAFT_295667 [Aplosporella prunicola CBS 121167]KAF2145124.1 hypothetical protein K452DRAFT_295667 [Aplosporella prunicola CBS 121167]